MNGQKKAASTIFWICGILLFFVLLLFLHAGIRLSRDDFFYYPFAKHGLKEFVYRLMLHYKNTNGRLLVHSICALCLNHGPWLFALYNIVSIFIFLFLLVKLTVKDTNRLACFFLAALSGFWLMGGFAASEAVMWISGSFNYIFPALLLISYLYFLSRAKDTKGYVLALIFCLLSSVTTEITSALTLLLTVIFFFGSRRQNSRFSAFFAANIAAAGIGFLFLICSPGMHNRSEPLGSLAELIKRVFIHFTTFSQMSWEPGGIGGILIFSAASCGLCAYKTLKQKLLSAVMFFISAMALLTSLGVIYAAWCYIVLDIFYFAALVWFGAALFRRGENAALLAVVCFAAAFAIMCASGIVGFRMLFLPAMCLLAIALCALSLARLSSRTLYAVCVVAAVFSAAQIVCLARINQKNAAVWDENQKIIERFQSGGELELKNVYDEFIFQGGVPVDNNFGHSYLAEFGIDDKVRSYSAEERYYTALDENNMVVTDKILKRGGDYYISCERLAEYLNAPYAWRYETSELLYRGELYRFHYGARSALTSYIGGRSKKLSAPVRIVDSDLKISVSDANALFHANLTVQ